MALIKLCVEYACERESVEVIPCVTKTRAISMALACVCSTSSWARALVVPRTQSLERIEISGTSCVGMALRMIWAMGEIGGEAMLIPRWWSAMASVRAIVMGEEELARAAAESDWSW